MAAVPDALRVSVVAGHDRLDLVVPAAVDVAELLPELTRRLGPRDPLVAVRLSPLGGPPLRPDAGLADQDVPDGAVLVLGAETARPPRREDDLASAVAVAVEAVPGPAAGAVWWCGVVLAATMSGLAGLGTLALGDQVAALGSAVVAALLLATSALGARRGAPRVVVGGAAWLAVAHAVAAASALGPLAAGAAACLAGGVAALLVDRRGTTLWAAVVAGAVVLLCAVVAAAVPAPMPLVLTTALVLAVAAGDLAPWLAATLAGLVPPPLGEDPPGVPDPAEVAAAVRRAHDLMLVSTVATGLLEVALAPVAVLTGPWGLAVALACCALCVLRSRRQRLGAGGLASLVGGLAPLVPIAAAAWWRWPEWRVAVVLGVLAVGLVALGAVLAPAPRTARAGRLAEIAEALVLVALPPVLLAATGLLDRVAEMVG